MVSNQQDGNQTRAGIKYHSEVLELKCKIGTNWIKSSAAGKAPRIADKKLVNSVVLFQNRLMGPINERFIGEA